MNKDIFVGSIEPKGNPLSESNEKEILKRSAWGANDNVLSPWGRKPSPMNRPTNIIIVLLLLLFPAATIAITTTAMPRCAATNKGRLLLHHPHSYRRPSN